jgi:hypothetical protein
MIGIKLTLILILIILILMILMHICFAYYVRSEFCLLIDKFNFMTKTVADYIWSKEHERL